MNHTKIKLSLLLLFVSATAMAGGDNNNTKTRTWAEYAYSCAPSYQSLAWLSGTTAITLNQLNKDGALTRNNDSAAKMYNYTTLGVSILALITSTLAYKSSAETKNENKNLKSDFNKVKKESAKILEMVESCNLSVLQGDVNTLKGQLHEAVNNNNDQRKSEITQLISEYEDHIKVIKENPSVNNLTAAILNLDVIDNVPATSQSTAISINNPSTNSTMITNNTNSKTVPAESKKSFFSSLFGKKPESKNNTNSTSELASKSLPKRNFSIYKNIFSCNNNSYALNNNFGNVDNENNRN